MKVFAITGLIASGKTTVTDHLKSKGFPVFDADDASKRVVDKNTEEGKEGFAQIFRLFGPTVLNSLGQLDRRALAKRIMLNPHEREKLEEIINPRLHELIRITMTKWKADGVELGFIEGARIVESKIYEVVAGVIRITSTEDNRVKRLVKRDSMGKDEAKALVQMQDSQLIDRYSKIEWKNDKKIDDLKRIINAFVEEKLDAQ